jgi:hypothetical protein
VLEGQWGEDSIAELCRREGVNQKPCYRWSKEFLGAGQKRKIEHERFLWGSIDGNILREITAKGHNDRALLRQCFREIFEYFLVRDAET